jgi:ATP-dependent Clp protease ATP-binding subunit ClpC
MFERLTDRARRVLAYAQDEAREFQHSSIGTEHILLGLIREGDGLAGKALGALGVNVDLVRDKVREFTELATTSSSASLTFTPRAKKVLELSFREALQLGHNYIGTEHLLLGLVREGDSVAIRILAALEIDASLVRAQVLQSMSGQSGPDPSKPTVLAHVDSAIYRGVVRAVGQQLRPDLDATALDERSLKIAEELFAQLRRRWTESG